MVERSVFWRFGGPERAFLASRDVSHGHKSIQMAHPDPCGPPDHTPIQVGEVWENPITGEYATILELPHQNSEGRAAAELLARAGAEVVGEHRHPGIVERFTVLEGELTVNRTAVFVGVCHEKGCGVWQRWRRQIYVVETIGRDNGATAVCTRYNPVPRRPILAGGAIRWQGLG